MIDLNMENLFLVLLAVMLYRAIMVLAFCSKEGGTKIHMDGRRTQGDLVMLDGQFRNVHNLLIRAHTPLYSVVPCNIKRICLNLCLSSYRFWLVSGALMAEA
jgi:hypothetical protein